MKKTKFTFIDAIIILFAVVLILAAALFLKSSDVGTNNEKNVYFTVMATEAQEGITEFIKEGDEVSISFAKEAYATVVGASEVPCEKDEYFLPKGIYMTHAVPGKADVKVLLRCKANVTDTEMSVGEVTIRVGDEMPVIGKSYTLKGYVIEAEDR